MRIESLQKLQNKAARIVTGSPYDALSVPLRKELGWLSIKEMIVKETSTMTVKFLHDLAPQYFFEKTLSCRGTKVWNKFNNNIKEAPPLGIII